MCTTSRACSPPRAGFAVRIVLRVLTLAVLMMLPRAEARAETLAVPVHVVVEARRSCTDEDTFWSEVTKRTNELRRAPEPDRAPVLHVRAWQVDGVVRGELTLRTARGEELPPRRVVGRTCQEVTSALALALVLAMEEGILTRESTPASRESAVVSQEPEAESAAPAPAPSREPPPPPRLPNRVTPRRVEISMGAHGIVLAADGLASGAGIFSELRPPLFDGRLSGRLEAARLGRGISLAEGQAELSWLFLRAEICLAPAATLALSFCALADGGTFSASATRAANPQSYSAPWFGAGASMNAAWRWSRWAGIEGEVGVLAPIVSDDLVFRPNTSLFRTPAVMTWLAVGPVIHFD